MQRLAMDWPNDATTLDALAKRLADDLSPAGMTYLAERLNRYAKKRLNAYRRGSTWHSLRRHRLRLHWQRRPDLDKGPNAQTASNISHS